jgi:NADH-quinone oxidoreductase subunit N
LTKLTGIPDREDAPDIYTLVFGATLGMCLMVSANHLLTVFLAVEMASVPSYVLAGMMKGRRKASEAALKYSDLWRRGRGGHALRHQPHRGAAQHGPLADDRPAACRVRLAAPSTVPAGELMVLALPALLISVGLAFKLSAVPFHFWCPDVFEGATAEVNAFLSIASKAAALALLVRVAILGDEGVDDSDARRIRPGSAFAGHGKFGGTGRGP